MMYPAYGSHTPDALPISHPRDVFFDDFSTHMSVSQTARKLSRGSGGQTRPGLGMRISKPNSANVSPRSTTISNRRRTMMGGDVWTGQRQQQVLDYLSIPQKIDSASVRKQSTRPLSWHPSSYHHPHAPQQPFLQQYVQQQEETSFPFPTPTMYGTDCNELYGNHAQFSPMMTSYSNDTSPSSTFSPLPLFPTADNTHFGQAVGWDTSQQSGQTYAGSGSQGVNDSSLMLNGGSDAKASSANGLDWNTFILQGFNNTTPPTPEAFSQQHHQLNVSEAAVPYQTLDEAEEEGEILVGMGLYDTPEKFHEDPQLNNYRSTVSSLLGSSYRPHEPQGKGLKLEETWEPPKADEEEEDEEEEEDANEFDGEEESDEE